MATHGSEEQWWSKNTLAVVTGGNKGIGYEAVKQLAEKGISVIIAARDETRGSQAAKALSSAGLNVTFHVLEVGNKQSIRQFAEWLKQEHGGLDILVNNAGVFSFSSAEAFNPNYWGTVWLTRELLPLFNPSPAGARIVNVSSLVGKLQYLGHKAWLKKLTDISKLDEETVNSFVAEYIQAEKAGTIQEWNVADDVVLEGHDYPAVPRSFTAYHASKVALNAFTRVLAKDPELHTKGRKIYVNAMHPGYVKTDMNPNGEISVQDGADTIVWLALLPASPNSAFFYLRKEWAW